MANLAQVVVQLKKEKQAIEAQLSNINAAVAALHGLGRGTTPGRAPNAGPRRVMSASARRRIAAAQRARWATWRKANKRTA
jgi:hypothetical protein